MVISSLILVFEIWFINDVKTDIVLVILLMLLKDFFIEFGIRSGIRNEEICLN